MQVVYVNVNNQLYVLLCVCVFIPDDIWFVAEWR